ncbi:acyl-CoA dehydrogenase family protein [Bacillus sp. B15-48]|uniref:acyl-CoA dehydrogenase family protein n=1 Tax=Bacillus sp. B15-48 TaxID=1548601 RepID=UPI00193F70D2|nr:acyl-CoA dehydrogenase family protein [Bacillus sp. B15-48]MBM4765161.1 acyl-CoA dehydrogenase [Bacillus sp. B15-48]
MTEKILSKREMPERLMSKIYHDMIMPEETQKIRMEVREFVNKEVIPIAHELGARTEDKKHFPYELIEKMGKSGILGIPFSKEVGGRGLEYPVCGTIVAMEELAYASNSLAAIYDVQCMLCGNGLTYGSDYIKDRYLKPLIKGEKIGSFATTEPDASTDLSVRTVTTTAEKVGDKWIINGRKRFISNSPVASYVALLCRTGETITEFVVDLDAPGVTVGEPDKKIGNKGQLTADIYFDDVEVGDENRLGDVGKGLRIALATLTFGRIGIASTGVGMAQSALDEVVDYFKHREAFGKKLGQFQYWQFKIVDWMTAIENARNLTYKAARRRDEGLEFPEPESAMAKFYATQIAGDIARDAVQAFGGYGFLNELAADGSTYKVAEIYRDSKIAEIYEGTNEIQKVIIARQVFGKEFTG